MNQVPNTEELAALGETIKELERQANMCDLYHCTNDCNQGNTIVANRQPPRNVEKHGEPNDDGICVAVSVPQCIAALPQVGSCDLYVYRATKPESATIRSGVQDRPITSEHFLLPGSSLERIDTIDHSLIIEICRNRDDLMRALGRRDGFALRAATIVAGCKLLPSYSTPGLADLLRKYLDDQST